MRFLFLGSPPFATPVLERLTASRHDAVALVTPPDRPRGRGRSIEPSALVRFARERGITVLQPELPKSPEFVAELAALEPDVLVVASYGVILPQSLLELAPHGALNVHASLLPRHRGASPIQAALWTGDEETGVTVQRIVAALDEGDVLVARGHPIGSQTTSRELLAELAPLGGEAIVEALDRIEAGEAEFTPQDPELATYARKIKKEHGRIDFNRSAREIERQVRALASWPGARCLDPKGRELTVARAAVIDAGGPAATGLAVTGQPGEILDTEGRLVVATGEGALEILELVPAGKRAMPAADYLRGARLERGQSMGAEAPVPSFVLGAD